MAKGLTLRWMDICVVVGLNFSRLRRQRGLTQEKIAEDTEISQQYLSGLESGKRNPTVKTLAKIADALGVEPTELITWKYDISG